MSPICEQASAARASPQRDGLGQRSIARISGLSGWSLWHLQGSTLTVAITDLEHTDFEHADFEHAGFACVAVSTAAVERCWPWAVDLRPAWMPVAEWAESDLLTDRRRRWQWLAGRAAARKALLRLHRKSTTTCTIRSRGSGGVSVPPRIWLDGCSDGARQAISLSISHYDDLAIALVAPPGWIVGVDVAAQATPLRWMLAEAASKAGLPVAISGVIAARLAGIGVPLADAIGGAHGRLDDVLVALGVTASAPTSAQGTASASPPLWVGYWTAAGSSSKRSANRMHAAMIAHRTGHGCITDLG